MNFHSKMYSAYITFFVVILVAVVPDVLANALGCKMACKKCRDKMEHPSIVKVYCEMCEECKAKRDQRLKMALRYESTLAEISPDIIHVDSVYTPPITERVDEAHRYSHFTEIVEVDNLSECPPPPPCEDIIKLTVKTTIMTTTTTTTTKKPTTRRCPPAPKCVLRKTTPCPQPPPMLLPPIPVYPCMQAAMPVPMYPMQMQPNYVQPMYAYPPPQPLLAATPSPAAVRRTATATTEAPTSVVVKLTATSPTTTPSSAPETTEFLSVFVGIPKTFDIDDEELFPEDHGE